MDNKCNLCGDQINLDEFELKFEIPQLMKEKGICFKCAFWIKRRSNDDDLLRVEGSDIVIPVITPDWSHWIVKPYENIMVDIGTFAKVRLESTRYYMAVIHEKFPDKLWLIDNNNIYHQGIIPNHLRNLYTPNGIYLSPMEWRSLQNQRNLTPANIKKMIENQLK